MTKEGERILYTENLRMRAFYRAYYTLTFLVFLVVSLSMLSLPSGVFKTAMVLAFFIPVFGFPAFKFLIARITTEITTDGLYVKTNFPSGRRLRLFGWEQLSACELKYWPRWGLLGDAKGGLLSGRWSCGRYVSLMMTVYRSYHGMKPLFGDREVCFTVREHGKTRIVVLNTNKPADFGRAVEQAMGALTNESFALIIEEESSFTERYFTQIIIGCLLLMVIIGLFVWQKL